MKRTEDIAERMKRPGNNRKFCNLLSRVETTGPGLPRTLLKGLDGCSQSPQKRVKNIDGPYNLRPGGELQDHARQATPRTRWVGDCTQSSQRNLIGVGDSGEQHRSVNFE
ncbi:hypothetical protein M378DRAFT_163081, partial [Amanita muscaria Koide BX008]